MSKRKNKDKKGGALATVNAPTAQAQQSTEVIKPPQTQSLSSTLKEHPVFVVVSLLVTALVAAATVVPAAGYVQEKWQETVATVDFSGDIDQQKPFSIPLAVKNPSQIFTMYSTRASCWADIEYETGEAGKRLLLEADQGAMLIGPIPPGKAGNYPCDLPGNVAVHNGPPDAPTYPLRQADMLVVTEYETWVPFTISRHYVTHFVMFKTTSGFRWIKGEWL